MPILNFGALSLIVFDDKLKLQSEEEFPKHFSIKYQKV